jgi:uncharacterized membrane protein YGL010W
MSSLSLPARRLLTMYAAYHRDRRNIATHFFGIPLIVFGVCVLLSRPGFIFVDQPVGPVHFVCALAVGWYLTRGAFVLGLATSILLVGLTALAFPLAAGSTASWLAWGLGTFVVGWILQFIGHKYEGRKPAFVDDLVGLLVGPMFVVAEVLFAMGWGKALLAQIEAEVGPTRSATPAQAA